MKGDPRRSILIALLGIFWGAGNHSDIGFLQDYHYDMAEAYYHGRISRSDYVEFLQTCKYEKLDNLQMLALLDRVQAIPGFNRRVEITR